MTKHPVHSFLAALALAGLACGLLPPPATNPATPLPPARSEGSPPPSRTGAPETTVGPSQAADIVFHNGTIHTMDPRRPSAQAIAIKSDTILAVGSDDDIIAMVGEDTIVIDLSGHTVLPGFNDAHSHLLGDYGMIGIADLESAIEEALRLGYTSVTEMFANEERINAFLALDREGSLPIRVNAYMPLNYGTDRFGDWYQAYEPGHEYSPFLRIAGVKVFIDSGNYGAKYLTEPYADNPGSYGEVFFTQDELDAVLTAAHGAGYQIAAHTGGDAALDMILNSLERVLDGASNEAYHHRVEHVMIARDDQIQRMSDLGIIASVQLSFFHSDWGDEFESTLGPQRAGWVGRWRDLLDAGVTVVGSTDAPWGYGEVRSPLKAIYQSVTRIGEGGSAPLSWMLDQRITVEEALDLMTLEAAYATFQDPVKGSLTPGKIADLIILSADPMIVDPEDLLSTNVWLTMVGGETRYCAPSRETFCP